MKSKLFGFSAKMALAVLAGGTMITSCYDSENGDVTKPYEAPDAVYTFIGTVTNDVTGDPVAGATVTLSGVISGNGTTDDDGTYQIVKSVDGGASGTVTVTVTGSDFDSVTTSITVAQVSNGQAVTYFKNVVVNYTTYIPEGVSITSDTTTGSSTTDYTGEDTTSENYAVALDIVNDTDEPVLVTMTFNVRSGSIVVDDENGIMGLGAITKAEAYTDSVKAALYNEVLAYLGGVAPAKEYDNTEMTYTFLLAANSALSSATVTYTYENKVYTATYKDLVYTVEIQRIISVSFNANQTTTALYHGHGHGHGGSVNAGGGILSSDL